MKCNSSFMPNFSTDIVKPPLKPGHGCLITPPSTHPHPQLTPTWKHRCNYVSMPDSYFNHVGSKSTPPSESVNINSLCHLQYNTVPHLVVKFHWVHYLLIHDILVHSDHNIIQVMLKCIGSISCTKIDTVKWKHCTNKAPSILDDRINCNTPKYLPGGNTESKLS